MARPLWSGTIQISLVGFAVEIYPATNTTRPISFHEIDRNTMARVRRANVSEQAEEEEKNTSLHLAAPIQENDALLQRQVAKTDIVKGYEYEKGKYAIVEPDELKNLRLAGKKTIEITQFSGVSEIDPALYEKPYFVMPKAGPQAVAFSVVRQSMAESGMVGVGEIVFSGRQHLMTLAPPSDPSQPGMVLYTLRFGSEMREAKDYSTGVEPVKADAGQLGLAKQLIAAYTQPFDLSKFKDHYEEALRELVEAKIRNLPAPAPEVEKKPPQVIDLMEALRKSLAQAGATKPEEQAAPRTKTASGSKRKKSA